MKKERKNPLRKSFGYAFEGILTGILQERNMKIHCVAIILVTAAGTLCCLRQLYPCLLGVSFSFLMYLNWQKGYSDHQKRNV